MKTIVIAPAAPNRRRLPAFRHLATLLGALIVGTALLVAIFAPVLTPHDPFAQDLNLRLVPPVWMDGSMSTQRSITNSQSDTTGHKYTQTFSVKGGIDKVIEVSASASFEESDSKTISLTDQKTNTETVTDTISTQVNVPAGKKYAYHVVVYYGKVNVPYTAHSTFQSTTTGAKPVQVITQGVFTGVNKTNNEIVIRDITSPQADQQKLVGRLPLA